MPFCLFQENPGQLPVEVVIDPPRSNLILRVGPQCSTNEQYTLPWRGAENEHFSTPWKETEINRLS